MPKNICTITVYGGDTWFRIHYTHHINFGYWFEKLVSESEREFVLEADRKEEEKVEGIVWAVNPKRLDLVKNIAELNYGADFKLIEYGLSNVNQPKLTVEAQPPKDIEIKKPIIKPVEKKASNEDQLSLF